MQDPSDKNILCQDLQARQHQSSLEGPGSEVEFLEVDLDIVMRFPCAFVLCLVFCVDLVTSMR
jgi:hypothetical protein